MTYPDDYGYCDVCDQPPGKKCLDMRYSRDERRFHTDRPHIGRAHSEATGNDAIAAADSVSLGAGHLPDQEVET